MKSLAFSSIVLASSVFASSAFACTYAIDESAKKAELTAVAVASLDKNLAVVSTEVLDLSYVESKPTPMCPEELTYTAQIEVSFTDSNGSSCMTHMKVTKVEPWGDNDTNTYTVSGGKHSTCLAN